MSEYIRKLKFADSPRRVFSVDLQIWDLVGIENLQYK